MNDIFAVGGVDEVIADYNIVLFIEDVTSTFWELGDESLVLLSFSNSSDLVNINVGESGWTWVLLLWDVTTTVEGSGEEY